MAATPETFPGFSAEQTSTIGRLSSLLLIAGPLLIVVGVARLALAVAEIWKISWGGLLMVPEGALLAFSGLILLVGSFDAGYLRAVKGREKEHLSNTYRSLNDATTALLILGCYLAFIHMVNLLIRLAS